MKMNKTPVEQLSSLSNNLKYENLPQNVIHNAKRIILDSLGCALVAYKEPVCRIVRQTVDPFVVEKKRPGYSRFIGDTHFFPAPLANLVSGSLIRCFDYNDVLWGRDPSHPSSNLSVALTCTDMVSGSGKNVILGLVLGYEMQIRFIDFGGEPRLWDRGWDHSSTLAISAPLIAANLMKLSDEQAAHALALSITHGSTLGELRCGQIPMHKASVEAFVSKNGIESALLAKNGLTGPLNVLTGRLGFERTVAGRCEFDKILSPIPDGEYRIMRSALKYFPAKGMAQTAIQASINLAIKYNLKPSEIQKVKVKLFTYALTKPNWDKEKLEPMSRETADHSFSYLVAAALVTRQITLEQYASSEFHNPVVKDVMSKVFLETDEELTKLFPETMPAEVEVHTSRGTFTDRVDYWKGHPRNPMKDSDVEDKFRQLTKHILSPKQQDRICTIVWKLEEISRIDELFEAMLVFPS